jgi:hypothetical protein
MFILVTHSVVSLLLTSSNSHSRIALITYPCLTCCTFASYMPYPWQSCA